MGPKVQKYLTIILPWGSIYILKCPHGAQHFIWCFPERNGKILWLVRVCDDILVMIKWYYNDHINKLRTSLQKMLHMGMKIKYFFLHNWGQIPGLDHLAQELEAVACKSWRNNQHVASKNCQATPRICMPSFITTSGKISAFLIRSQRKRGHLNGKKTQRNCPTIWYTCKILCYTILILARSLNSIPNPANIKWEELSLRRNIR